MDNRTAMIYNRMRESRENGGNRSDYRGGGYDREMRGYDNRYRSEYGDMRGGDRMRMTYRSEYPMMPEDRFRDRRGREHYENGRFAPRGYYDEPMRIGFAAGRSTGGRYEMGGAAGYGDEGLTEEEAHEWAEGLRNSDGTTGPHWTMEQTDKVMQQRGIDCNPVEFWAVMNALYSDYGTALKKYNMAGNVSFFADMAKAWLDDEDAVPDKAAEYFRCIVDR